MPFIFHALVFSFINGVPLDRDYNGVVVPIPLNSTIIQVNKSANYPDTLVKGYPPGINIENHTEGNKTTQKIIIVRNGEANKFIKTSYSWGGVYFFKNNISILQSQFEKETKALEGEPVKISDIKYNENKDGQHYEFNPTPRRNE